MESHWTGVVARLGAELAGPPAHDLLPTGDATLAWLAVEQAEGGVAPDADTVAAVAALHRLLGRTPRPWCGPVLDGALAGLDPTWAPAQAVRLAAALAAGLLAGHLPAGRPWAVHIEDPVGAARTALAPVVDLLAGLLDAWDPTLAPPSVTTNVGSVHRDTSGYRPGPDRLATLPDLWVELDPSTPAGDPLPGPLDAPAVVVRPAPPDAADPGLPPPAAPAPDVRAAQAAVARWCGLGDGGAADRAAVLACLFDPAWPAPADADRPPGRFDQDASPWSREVADLVLAERPELPGSWLRRALVESGHPAGGRSRHRRLVEAAAARGAAADDLLGHAAGLRRRGRGRWALDVWAVADDALAARLAAEVVGAPSACHPAELPLALAVRLEAAAAGSRSLASGTGATAGRLVPGQTAG